MISRIAAASGAAAGLVGGAAMALWMTFVSGVAHVDFFLPWRLIGATFYGAGGMAGMRPVLTGLVLHAIVSAGWGVAFASQRRVGAAIATAIVLVVMTFAVLPIFDPTMFRAVLRMPFLWLGAHALYGGGLATLPRFAERFHLASR